MNKRKNIRFVYLALAALSYYSLDAVGLPYNEQNPYLDEDLRRMGDMSTFIRDNMPSNSGYGYTADYGISVVPRYINDHTEFFLSRARDYLRNNFGANYTSSEILQIMVEESWIDGYPEGYGPDMEVGSEPHNLDQVNLYDDPVWMYNRVSLPRFASENTGLPVAQNNAVVIPENIRLPVLQNNTVVSNALESGTRQEGFTESENSADTNENENFNSSINDAYIQNILEFFPRQEDLDELARNISVRISGGTAPPELYENPPSSISGGTAPPELYENPPSKVKILQDEIQKENTLSPKISKGSVSLARHVVAQRLSSNISAGFQEEAELVGISSGDSDSRMALWTKVLLGSMEQERANFSNPYVGRLYGSMVGLEFKIGDSSNLGFGVGVVASNVKKKGEIGTTGKVTTKAKTALFSVYGQTTMNDNFIINGSGTSALSKVRTSRYITADNINYIGNQRHYDYGMNVEASLGYKYNLTSKVAIIPTIGTKYQYSHSPQRTEEGDGALHAVISKSSDSELSGIVSVVVLGKTAEWKSVKLTPHITLAAERRLYQNHHLSQTSHYNSYSGYYIDGSSDIRPIKATKAHKHPNNEYNAEIGIKANYLNLDCSLEYSIHLYEKYQAHTGSIALKLHL